MGLFDKLKKTENTEKDIFETINKSDWLQVFSACLGKSMVIQNNAGKYVVKDRNWNVDFGCTFLQPREETMQYQIAKVINETPDATLLNYGFMDAGFFTAAGIAPNVKFFHSSNVDMPEKREEQLRYIREGLVDYVITHKEGPKELEGKYELVATAESPSFWYENVFLYRILSAEKR